jgi:hypothetical protein
VIAGCRRCNASDEHAQQLASALQVLQQEAAELQAQLARAEDNQRAAAAQMSQVLSINRSLQVRLLHIQLLQRRSTVPCALLLQVNQQRFGKLWQHLHAQRCVCCEPDASVMMAVHVTFSHDSMAVHLLTLMLCCC